LKDEGNCHKVFASGGFLGRLIIFSPADRITYRIDL